MSCDLTIRFKPRDVAARSQAAPYTAQSCAALLDALISNKVAMWFAARPDQISNASVAQGAGKRQRWKRLSGGALGPNQHRSFFFCGALSPGGCGSARCQFSMNLVSTPCLAPDHSGLEANILRFDDPVQSADVAARSQAAPRQSPRNHVRRSWTPHIEQGSDVVRGELLDLDQISNASVAQRAGAAALAATVGRSIHFSCTK